MGFGDVLLILFCCAVLMGVMPVRVGNRLVKNSEHKALGKILKVIGYIFLVPLLVIGLGLGILVMITF